MICNACQQNEGTVRVTRIIGGYLQTVDLCDACARENGAADPAGFSTEYITGQPPTERPPLPL
jgi:protein-arginine kinase activator protein McsA